MAGSELVNECLCVLSLKVVLSISMIYPVRLQCNGNEGRLTSPPLQTTMPLTLETGFTTDITYMGYPGQMTIFHTVSYLHVVFSMLDKR